MQPVLERPAANCPRVVATYPLSALQEGMLFDSLTTECPGLNVEQLTLELDGTLNASRLAAAWQAVSARHDALRTAFRFTPDGPRQDVWENVALPFTIEGVPLADPAERRRYVEDCVARERRAGFSLNVAPLQRVRLIRFGRNAQTLIWTNHHAIMDGRARALVLREIVETYAGREPAGRPTPFAEYIRWLQERDPSGSEPFWRERLRGFSAATPLPAAFAVATAGTPDALTATAERTLFGRDTADLLELARAHDLSMNVLIQAAWSLLLSRHAGTPDVVFGAVRAGRRSAIDGSTVAGMMICTVPVRIAVDEDAAVIPWLKGVRARWEELREHEHLPLREIAGWSEIAAPHALFESLVVYERETFARQLSTRIDPDGTFGIRCARMHDQTGFPLTLAAAGTAELELRLQYDTRRYGAADASRLLDHLIAILRNLPAGREGQVAGITMFPAGERERILTRWNRVTQYPRNATVHALFAERARETPDATALQLGDRTMTYAELDARSGTIARHLRGRGIGTGAFVAVHVERSFDMVAALLGILKVGAASLALDLNYSAEQCSAILSEAGVEVILSQAPLIADLAPLLALAGPRAPAVVILETLTAEADDARDTLEDATVAQSAAHVMYTSGSTGTPKGAVLPHRAVTRTVCGTDYLRFASDETFFAFVPLTFDVSILELWGPLLNGARLVLCPPGLPSLDVLAATIEAQGVTTLWLTTALFEQMVEEQLPRLQGLRQLIVGGDVLSPAHARRAMEAFPQLRLLNVYGPTEATVLITAHRLRIPLAGPVPLGAPIPNATVYVLDRRQRPVPIGVPGEIYTGGDGVALGYLNRPALTAERFLPDPFSCRPNAVMYRTGDLARWRDDGTIDFLGRVDDQVKIRGIRIELGAIESALTEHPGVREAVVIAAAGSGGDKQLVAYCVARDAAGVPPVDEIQAFLGRRLPAYCVPRWVTFTGALPRTPTGKFDRKALRDSAAPLENTVRPTRSDPQTPAEIAVAGHVAAILGLDDIGRDDDFYAFGGDSLRAMRLVSRLRETFGVALTVRDLVAAPNVGALTTVISAFTRDARPVGTSRVRALRTTGDLAPIFFLHGDLAGGGRYCDEILRQVDARHPFFAIEPHGAGGDDVPASIEAMARENVAAIRERYPIGPVILGGFCNGGIVAFEMARRLERAATEVTHLAIVDAFLFNQTAGTPLAAQLRRLTRALPRTQPKRTAGTSWAAWHDRLVADWYRALYAYTPRSYRGSMSLVWSDEMGPRAAELTRIWQRVAPHATADHRMPGTHLTSITRHLGAASRSIAAAIERRTTG